MSMWGKIKAFFKNSVTILWARITMAVGFLMIDPSVWGAVQQIIPPWLLPYVIIAVGIITELSRRRTVGKATDTDNRVMG